jgi:hypothetical protein
MANPSPHLFALALGDNAFTFAPEWVDYPIDTVGLNLFFNLSGVSFNPVYEAGVGIPGNLSAFTVADSSCFRFRLQVPTFKPSIAPEAMLSTPLTTVQLCSGWMTGTFQLLPSSMVLR